MRSLLVLRRDGKGSRVARHFEIATDYYVAPGFCFIGNIRAPLLAQLAIPGNGGNYFVTGCEGDHLGFLARAAIVTGPHVIATGFNFEFVCLGADIAQAVNIADVLNCQR